MTGDMAEVPDAHRTMYDVYSDTCREILTRRSAEPRFSRPRDQVPPGPGDPPTHDGATTSRDGSAADVT
jgi:hypothetical protein